MPYKFQKPGGDVTFITLFLGVICLLCLIASTMEFNLGLLIFGIIGVIGCTAVWFGSTTAAWVLGGLYAMGSVARLIRLFTVGFTWQEGFKVVMFAWFSYEFIRWAGQGGRPVERKDLESDDLPDPPEEFKPTDAELETTFRDLSSPIERDRDIAADKLGVLPEGFLSLKQGLRALEIARCGLPKPGADFRGRYEIDLIAAAATAPHAGYVSFLRKNYDGVDNELRAELIGLLFRIDDPQAVELGMRHALASRKKIEMLPLYVLDNNPRHPDVVFPDIFELAEAPHQAGPVWHVTLSYARAKLLTPDHLAAGVAPLVFQTRSTLDQLIKLQPEDVSGVAWRWEEKYSDLRTECGLMLDVLGYLPTGGDVVSVLADGLKSIDPRVKCFAALSLLRLQQPVDPGQFANIAADPETCNVLYDQLFEMGAGDFYPQEFITQEGFAESDMVNWLIFPTELGRAPDEIELMDTITIGGEGEDDEEDEGPVDFFVFRFRTFAPHWAADDGWQAGISGPFPKDRQPTTTGMGATFSSFKKWNEHTSENHLRHILGLLD